MAYKYLKVDEDLKQYGNNRSPDVVPINMYKVYKSDGNTGGNSSGKTGGNSGVNTGNVQYNGSYTEPEPLQEQKSTGYVAPSNQLKMPNVNSNYAAAPDAYTSKWQSQIDDLMDRIMNREAFSYDLDGDMLYNQYKNQYQLLGRQAMADTMGQASGLTGGYASTYGQAAGQQAYDSYLQQLNDKIPELYALSRNAYDQEGQNLMNQYGLLGDRENQDYSRYQDSYDKWLTERSHQEERDDLAWNREYQFQQDSYDRQQNNYNNLAALISTYGYNPTDEELKDAGMSRSVADTMRNAWVSANTPKTSGGYRGSPDKGSPVLRNAETTENARTSANYREIDQSLSAAVKGGADRQEMRSLIQGAVVANDITQNQAQKLLNKYIAK